MNLKELYEIVDKFDKTELWEGDRPSQFDIHASQFGLPPKALTPPNDGVLARRKIVIAAYDSIAEQIKLAGSKDAGEESS